MSGVKTSVITLTHKRLEWLEEAIRSIEAQTDQDYEHYVYDKSTDNPRVDGVLRLATDRRRDKFHAAQSKKSPTDVVGFYWNALLHYAQGKYVTILDDDNRKRPDFLEKMTAPMEADEGIDAVSCGWAIVDEAGELTGEERHCNLETSLIRLWEDNTIDSNALVFRRSVLDKIGMFDPELTTNEDWHFVIRLVRRCRVVHLPDALLEYRVHSRARSRDAVALGAHANWKRIRDELFTREEQRAGMRAAVARNMVKQYR